MTFKLNVSRTLPASDTDLTVRDRLPHEIKDEAVGRKEPQRGSKLLWAWLAMIFIPKRYKF